MRYQDVLARLKSLSNPKNKEGMARFGLNTDTAFGISIYTLRSLAKEIGKDHEIAKQLWDSEFMKLKSSQAWLLNLKKSLKNLWKTG